jgi:hypothetical protein
MTGRVGKARSLAANPHVAGTGPDGPVDDGPAIVASVRNAARWGSEKSITVAALASRQVSAGRFWTLAGNFSRAVWEVTGR